MNPEIAGITGLALLLALLLTGMPIGFVLGLVGITGLSILLSPEAAVIKSGVIAFHTVMNYELGVLPMFLLMANITFATGASKEFFDAAARLIGHRRGGLAIAAVGGCAGFGAVSGSSLATAATMGLVAIPEMRKHRYAPSLVSGSVAAGGTLGSLIPPSGMLIIFGILTEQSIGKLFIAGIIPGISQALFYVVTIILICWLKPELGPASPRSTWLQRWHTLRNSFDMILLIIFVIGGLLLGWFTPTESGAVGAAGSVLIGLMHKKLTFKSFQQALLQTLKTAGVLYAIIIGALIFSTFMAVSRIPTDISQYLVSSNSSQLGIIISYLIVLFILGTFLDGIAILTLTVPIFFPIIQEMGINPIWYAILSIRALEIALITPPLGMNVYVIKSLVEDIPLGTIFTGVVPFLIADILHLAVLVAIPGISTILPDLM
jgi:tripartite ATP-independent transporter DctM subunit